MANKTSRRGRNQRRGRGRGRGRTQRRARARSQRGGLFITGAVLKRE
jgi:hypothetical protein